MNYPFVAASHFYKGGNRPRWIVIHDLEYPNTPGAARWAANYFATNVPKSAHYTVDPNEIIQSVREEDGAWHTPGYIQGVEVNRQSIGVEHGGYARDPWNDANASATLERSAVLVAEIAQRHGIPVQWLSPSEIRSGTPGIAGHDDFTIATGSGTHVDPGRNFPRDWYITRVRDAQGAGGSRLRSALIIAGLVGAAIWLATRPVTLPNDARGAGPEGEPA